MKTSDNFILDIKRLGINGEGIGFYNRKAVFVEDAIPGEGHSVEIIKEQEKMCFAKSIEVKHKSPSRVTPSCPYYKECGGCNVSHIAYEKMLEFKKESVVEAISRYTHLNPRSFEIRNTVASDEIFHYRNRSQLQVVTKDDHLEVAMLKPNSNFTVPIQDCLVQKQRINELNRAILSFAEELNISSYIPKFSRGILRYILIRVNEVNEALVCFVCGEKSSKIKELAKRTITLEGVKGVYESLNTSKKDVGFIGTNPVLLEGEPYIIEKLGKLSYKLYPNTFFQLNTKQTHKMMELILKACKLSFKERVLDAYSGVGAIGLYLAHMAKEVVGIEYNADAVEAANDNAKLNHIQNAKFLQGDAALLFPKLLEEKTFDVVVVDPPRTGLEDEFIQALLNAKVKRVVYVSCNPATLAKDLEKLSIAYQVNSITPLDMFPQTALTESVVQLTHIESAPVKNK